MADDASELTPDKKRRMWIFPGCFGVLVVTGIYLWGDNPVVMWWWTVALVAGSVAIIIPILLTRNPLTFQQKAMMTLRFAGIALGGAAYLMSEAFGGFWERGLLTVAACLVAASYFITRSKTH